MNIYNEHILLFYKMNIEFGNRRQAQKPQKLEQARKDLL